MRPPLLARCLITVQGGWSVEEGELCLGVGWHGYDVVREPGLSKAVHGQYLVPLNQASGHPRTQRLGANSDLWFCEDSNAAQAFQ